MLKTKRCSRCGKRKRLATFHLHPAGLGGRQNICRSCKREVDREYRQRNAARISARQRAKNAADPEPNRERARKWAEANRERTRENARRRYREKPEAVKATAKAWAAAHPERKRENDRRWRKEHPEKLREYARRYRDGALQASPKRRVELKAALYERDGGLCGICGEPVDLTDCHADHKIPVSKGGKPGFDNLQLAHPSCNRRRGGRAA